MKNTYNRNKLKQSYSLFERCKKHMTTAGIGGLSSFEEHFGRIWGHGKEPHEKTDSQLQWTGIWETCRNEFLDKMNVQIRSLKSKLEKENG